MSKLVSQLLLDPRIRDDLPCGSVVLDNVSKHFRKHTISRQSYTTFKSDLISKFRRRRNRRENYTEALTNFSLSLEPGSAVGVIGRNGSGKSTLLKLISGIYHPDSGNVWVNGRVSALIELGAGFHPDFTGRENLFLGGIMYGLTREEIQRRFDEIVGYAELENFIDDPVRTYSSGMYMRLGFSLAVHTSPDILLIDEVLAVGDAAFIARCQETISEFKRQGKTLLLVTHDLNAVVRWCDEAVWLDSGHVRGRGSPREVIDEYMRRVGEEEQQKLTDYNAASEAAAGSDAASREWNSPVLPSTVEERRWGSGDVEITAVKMRAADDSERWVFQEGEAVSVEVGYRIKKPVADLVFGIGIIRSDGLEVHGSNTDIDDAPAPLPDPGSSPDYPLHGTYRYRIERLGLLEDTYYLDVAVHRADGFPFDYHHRMHKFSVRSSKKHTGVCNPAHEWHFEPAYQHRTRDRGQAG